ncbi:MAG: hypothetical protein K2Q01_03985 [Rickettsiales bacterium]|nr:hypothetical protein [Rickettsiales bacterium]
MVSDSTVERSDLDAAATIMSLRSSPDTPLMYRDPVPASDTIPVGLRSDIRLLGGELDLSNVSPGTEAFMVIVGNSGRITLPNATRNGGRGAINISDNGTGTPTVISIPASAPITGMNGGGIGFDAGGFSVSLNNSGVSQQGNLDVEVRSDNPNVPARRIPVMRDGVFLMNRRALGERIVEVQTAMKELERNNGILPDNSTLSSVVSVPAAIPLTPAPDAPQR